MYDNIGEKIKSLAFVIFVIGTISSIIYGISVLSKPFGILFALIIFFIGPISSYIISLFVFGFGELIENSGNNTTVLPQSLIKNKNKNYESFTSNDNVPENVVICQVCGQKNAKNRETCLKCGAELK